MGAKILPGTPCMVNSGINATRMISVAKRTGLAASRHAFHDQLADRLRLRPGAKSCDTRSPAPRSKHPRECRSRSRQSKSDWPTDSVSTIMAKANSTANGIVIAAMKVMRRSPSMHEQHQRHQDQAGDDDVPHRRRSWC